MLEGMRLGAILLVALVIVPVFACRKDKPSTDTSPIAKPIVPNGPTLASALASSIVGDVGNTTASVKGTVHSTGGRLGASDLTFVACQSGERNGFFGADFYVAGSDDLRLRYVHDEAAGDVVKIALPSNDGMFMVLNHDSECSVLQGNVAKTNVQTWTPKGNVRHVEGHLKFDCPQTGGAKGQVSGEIDFSHCH